MIEPFLIKDYLTCMARIRGLDGAELEAYAARYVAGDDMAERVLEERCLPEVIRLVVAYRGLGVGFKELIELGNRGLVRGIRRFKLGRDVDMNDCIERSVVEEVEAVVFARKASLV